MHTFAEKPKASQQTTSAKSTIPGRAHFFGQSREVNFFLPLQRTIGNQATQLMLQTDSEEPQADLTRPASPGIGFDFSRIRVHAPAAGAIQRKLAINKPGDVYEQEADRIANQAMATPVNPAIGGAPPRIERVSGQSSGLSQDAVPHVVHEVINSPGQPLDATIRGFMEPRFGYDFGHVRVHSGPKAAASANEVGAIAYTIGQHVVIGERRPSLENVTEWQLWAHELAHVVQQGRGGSAPALTPSAAHERDADAAAMSLGMGRLNIQVACKTGIGLARATPSGPPGPPRPYLEVVRDIHGEEGVLQDLRQDALHILNDEGVNIEARGPQGPRIERVKQWLAGIASDPGSPRQAGAKKALERIEVVQKNLEELNQELRDIHAARSPGTTAHFESAEAKEESAGAKAKRATARSEGAAAKQSDTVASKEGGRLPAEESSGGAKGIAAESELSEGAAAKQSDTVASKEGGRLPAEESSGGAKGIAAESELSGAAAGLELGVLLEGLNFILISKDLLKLAATPITHRTGRPSAEEEALAELLQKKVNPDLEQAFKHQGLGSVAERLRNQSEDPVYANVTVDMTEERQLNPFSLLPANDDWENVDASFVSVDVSNLMVAREKILRDHVILWRMREARIKRVTHSAQLNFRESDLTRHNRVVQHKAATAVAQHQSPRLWGSSHVGRLSPADKRELLKPPTFSGEHVQDRRDRETRIELLKAYIQYAALAGIDAADAQKYLAELESTSKSKPFMQGSGPGGALTKEEQAYGIEYFK